MSEPALGLNGGSRGPPRLLPAGGVAGAVQNRIMPNFSTSDVGIRPDTSARTVTNYVVNPW